MNVNITLDDSDALALRFAIPDAEEWLRTAIISRAKAARDLAEAIALQLYQEAGVSVPLTEDARMADMLVRWPWLDMSKMVTFYPAAQAKYADAGLEAPGVGRELYEDAIARWPELGV